jgi:hypothetical protein
MLEKVATCAPVTRFLTVQEMCRLRIGCEYSRRMCDKRLFSKQLPINGRIVEVGTGSQFFDNPITAVVSSVSETREKPQRRVLAATFPPVIRSVFSSCSFHQ